MSTATDLLSPKQVARAIGVSESSLKRWCDRGLIRTVRTAGGHRKMAVAEVVRYVREHGQQVVAPSILGLPALSTGAPLGLARSRPRLVEALLAGDEPLARQIILDLYLARHPISVIFDEVLSGAFHEIGELWQCHRAEIYQERRGCEIAMRVLFDLRRLLPVPESDWLALGGTMAGDHYTLACAMAELVLRDVGYAATSLGTSIPVSSFVQAVTTHRPRLFWLSVSHIPEGVDFAGEFSSLSRACADAGTALAVGGRALTGDLRQRLTYSAFCDTMQHFEAFATALIGSRRVERPLPESLPSE